jgi:predicted branched-subunit amino acid permease
MTSSSETSRLSGRPAWAFDRRIFLNGMRDGVPIALGYFAVSFSLGIAARNAGLTPLQGFFASLLNNASAGEYAAFTLIAANATLFQVALITLIANARYLLMSCALAQRFAPGTPFFHRLIIAYDVTDELFGITISRPGCLNPFYTYGAILLAAPAWAFGTAFGIMAGNALPLRAVSVLSVALYGMFLAIIIPPARKNKVVAVLIVISFALSFFGSYVPGISALSDGTRTILLTVLISAAAAILFPVKNTQEEESEHES